MVELKNLKNTDAELYDAIMSETKIQQNKIELIASPLSVTK